ncbi:RNA-binding protein Tab2/Atab2, C-terminal [Dillenia turbinata]|uniref:RNA-binding protein Tab2/Atab2, C-terminal n=1 Tax=Dillenia turbinata TaxID=194707 RepID=A0AAN8VHS0_9MAGN
MACLGFNPAKIRNQNLHYSKPSSKIVPSSKPIKIKPSPSQFSFKLHCLKSNSVSEAPLSPTEPQISEQEEEVDDPASELSFLDPEIDPESITEWELDFCSRPILDIRGKKVWELVVCDSTLSLQYTKFFPNNVINSITLNNAIASISDDLGVPLPEKIRYFRSQMQTIITKASKELGIKPIPSKRERYETVYQRHPGFQKGAKPFLTLDNPFPMDLPDNLFGEKWAFVQLPFSAVQEEVATLKRTFTFGASFDVELLGIEIDDKTLIPGLAVATSRAKPLAAWMNGLEVCSIEADTARGCLYLSVGISTRYIYATYKKTPTTTGEAEAWEAAKKACGGLHFLAIQEDLDSDDCVGFWLLLDLPPPPV